MYEEAYGDNVNEGKCDRIFKLRKKKKNDEVFRTVVLVIHINS